MKIAIDGPSGAGKSAIAKELARRLNFEYIDTGSLYRTVAYISMKNGEIDTIDEIIAASKNQDIAYHRGKVMLNGQILGDEIRTEAISQKTSELSKEPKIRKFLLDLQRQLATQGDTVMEGRDIGTVILPDADIKFYLTASEDERAKRRWRQRKQSGEEVELKTIKDDIHKRDLRDRTREVAPLRQSEDAVVIDSTNMTEDEVLKMMIHHVEMQHVL